MKTKLPQKVQGEIWDLLAWRTLGFLEGRLVQVQRAGFQVQI